MVTEWLAATHLASFVHAHSRIHAPPAPPWEARGDKFMQKSAVLFDALTRVVGADTAKLNRKKS